MAEDSELEARKRSLKAKLTDLRRAKGFGTELVTIIIPPDRQISDARALLRDEHGQAANIKSKSTRKNVQAAIESAMSYLSRYKSAGERGLALFTGAIIVGNNKTRQTTYLIDDPPQEFLRFQYRCDSKFELEQLEDMLIDNRSYGLFVIDRSEAAYGIAHGTRYHVQEHLVSNIMGKHRQGGQSAQRFERLIEEAAHNFFKRATEHACSYWLPNLENIQAIFIGGPGATKDYVVRNEYFHHEIAKKIAKKHFDVGYSNEVGIRDLVSEAGDLMANIMLDEERKVMNQFLSELIKSQPKATYGDAMVRKALADGAVDTLLISENKIDHEGRYRCETCYESWNHGIHKPEQSRTCPGCKSDHTFHKIWTSHDEFSELASKSNSKVAYISNDTEEGTQLLLGFGGLAAILRYPMM